MCKKTRLNEMKTKRAKVKQRNQKVLVVFSNRQSEHKKPLTQPKSLFDPMTLSLETRSLFSPQVACKQTLDGEAGKAREEREKI